MIRLIARLEYLACNVDCCECSVRRKNGNSLFLDLVEAEWRLSGGLVDVGRRFTRFN